MKYPQKVIALVILTFVSVALVVVHGVTGVKPKLTGFEGLSHDVLS